MLVARIGVVGNRACVRVRMVCEKEQDGLPSW